MAYGRHENTPWVAATSFNGPRHHDFDNVGPYPPFQWLPSLDQSSPQIRDAIARARRSRPWAPWAPPLPVHLPIGPNGPADIVFGPQPPVSSVNDQDDPAFQMRMERKRIRNPPPHAVDMAWSPVYDSPDNFRGTWGERHQLRFHPDFTNGATRLMNETPEVLTPTSDYHVGLESSPLHSPSRETSRLEEAAERPTRHYNSHKHRRNRSQSRQIEPRDTRRGFPINLQATLAAILITAELPGVPKEGLSIYYNPSNTTLEISAATPASASFEAEAEACVKEVKSGNFYRKVIIPEELVEKWEVDADGVTAELKDGVLSVALPRAEKESTKVRRVEIE